MSEVLSAWMPQVVPTVQQEPPSVQISAQRAAPMQSAPRRRTIVQTHESSCFSLGFTMLPPVNAGNDGKYPCTWLYLNLDGNGKSPAHSKGFSGHFQHRSRLLAFVLGAL